MASGLEWSIVRCAFFAPNFNEGAWLDEVLGSKVQLADGVLRALGREPKDFTDFARETAATGVWTV
jgi:hypothetical protein